MARDLMIVLLASAAAWIAGSTQPARADALPRYLSTAGCGLPASAISRWHGDRRLDRAAALWSRGAALHDAVERSGYAAGAIAGLRVDDFNARRGPALDASGCRVLRDPSLVDIGVYERRNDSWVVFAAPVLVPAPGDEDQVAARALELVNRARQAPQQCGSRRLPPAAPLRLSVKLAAAASRHAQDMAQRHYFEHQDPAGRTPADRVRSTGYADRRVGENLAYGVLSTGDAIAGWLKSPEHCENLMDPKFREMGIGYAREQGEHTQVYWVLVLAAPR